MAVGGRLNDAPRRLMESEQDTMWLNRPHTMNRLSRALIEVGEIGRDTRKIRHNGVDESTC